MVKATSGRLSFGLNILFCFSRRPPICYQRFLLPPKLDYKSLSELRSYLYHKTYSRSRSKLMMWEIEAILREISEMSQEITVEIIYSCRNNPKCYKFAD